MSALKIAAVAVAGAILTGCAGSPDGVGPGPKENTGTLLGALGGAAIGSQFGGGTGGHVAGALIGAGIGGLIGNRIGAALDDEDKQRAYAAQMDALERGRYEIVLDLHGVAFIDLKTLYAIQRAQKICYQHNGHLAMTSVARPVLRAIELSGMRHALRVFPTRDEAIERLRERPGHDRFE